jgi:hypothetical protein
MIERRLSVRKQNDRWNWSLGLILFITPPTSDRIVVPSHRGQVQLSIARQTIKLVGFQDLASASPVVKAKGDAIFDGAGALEIHWNFVGPEITELNAAAELTLLVHIAGNDQPIVIKETIPPLPSKPFHWGDFCDLR